MCNIVYVDLIAIILLLAFCIKGDNNLQIVTLHGRI